MDEGIVKNIKVAQSIKKKLNKEGKLGIHDIASFHLSGGNNNDKAHQTVMISIN